MALALGAVACAGDVEVRLDRIVVRLTVAVLPEPGRVDVASRADRVVVREFQRRFPELMRWRRAAAGLPADRPLEVQLTRPTGIEVRGVEGSMLAIAGGVRPDVLYVDFRQSDTYRVSGSARPARGRLRDVDSVRRMGGTDASAHRARDPPARVPAASISGRCRTAGRSAAWW